MLRPFIVISISQQPAFLLASIIFTSFSALLFIYFTTAFCECCKRHSNHPATNNIWKLLQWFSFHRKKSLTETKRFGGSFHRKKGWLTQSSTEKKNGTPGYSCSFRLRTKKENIRNIHTTMKRRYKESGEIALSIGTMKETSASTRSAVHREEEETRKQKNNHKKKVFHIHSYQPGCGQDRFSSFWRENKIKAHSHEVRKGYRYTKGSQENKAEGNQGARDIIS